MNLIKSIILLAMTMSPTGLLFAEEPSIPFNKFIVNMYQKHKVALEKSKLSAYNNWLTQYKLRDNESNKDLFLKTHFLHDLFTCNHALNGPCNGALAIPYLWHWTSPNPRHKIKQTTDDKLLVSVKPSNSFRRYKSFADIDRVPSLFLSDLVSSKPKYKYPSIGEFYSFGWCSEREMSFSLVLLLFDINSRIVQQGNHVWSELWLPVKTNKNSDKIIVAIVDNTYDKITWQNVAGVNKESWLNSGSNSSHIRWYNKVARSKKQMKAIISLVVIPSVQQRIENQVKAYLRK